MIAIMFALTYGPLIAAAIMALTLSLKAANDLRAEAALDAALIAAAATPTSALPSGTSALQQAQANILDAYWSADNGPNVCESSGNPIFSSVSSTANGSTTTTLSAKIQCQSTVGSNANDFVASSAVQVGSAHIEIAMVLDNTGSMAWAVSSGDTNPSSGQYWPEVSSGTNPSKMTGLKIAAYNFINDLMSYAKAPNEIKVSIVPMDNDINICSSFSSKNVCTDNTAQGIVKYYSDKFTVNSKSIYDDQILAAPINTYNCTYQLSTGYSTSPIQISAGTTYISNQELNYSNSSPPCNDSYTYTVPTASSSASVNATNWLGCVTDRDQEVDSSGYVDDPPVFAAGNPSTNTSGIDYDTSDALPTGSTGNSPFSLYPADNINCGGYKLGPVPIVPLTDLYSCTSNSSSCTCTGGSGACTSYMPTALISLLYCRDSSYIYANNSKGVYTPYPDTNCENDTNTPSVLATNASSNTTAMIPNGGTDLTIGFAWGLNMLTPSFPLSPNAATSTSTTQVDKIIVFFTDGFNSLDRFNLTDCLNDNSSSCSPSGSSSAQYRYLENMNNETLNICNNIQSLQLDSHNTSNRITIYTVGTLDADAGFLSSCPSDPNNSTTGLSANQIDGAFQSILAKIVQIRVSQ